MSVRSLAFILASAIRRARALSCAALHRSPERMSGRNMTAKATKMLTKRATAFMPVSCEQITPSRFTWGISVLVAEGLRWGYTDGVGAAGADRAAGLRLQRFVHADFDCREIVVAAAQYQAGARDGRIGLGEEIENLTGAH